MVYELGTGHFREPGQPWFNQQTTGLCEICQLDELLVSRLLTNKSGPFTATTASNIVSRIGVSFLAARHQLGVCLPVGTP